MFTAFGRHNGTLLSDSAVVMTVTANSNMIRSEVLHSIIYMIQKGIDVAGSLQKERITANTDQAVLFYDCPADFIIFCPVVIAQSTHNSMTCHNGHFRNFSGFQTGSHSGVRNVYNDFISVHCPDDPAAEISYAAIIAFAAAGAEKVGPVVGKMHHTHAEIMKNPQQKFRFFNIDRIGDRNGIGGQNQTGTTVFVRLCQLNCISDLLIKIRHQQ